ncbi:sestrin-2-like isoform X2 [Oratosquilla oratoria]|uniref:sestrin-2-like isoform X2 n=1 Tax=Oratosquilla oratoria TaxID=337810 RepID=UPI003F763C27
MENLRRRHMMGFGLIHVNARKSKKSGSSPSPPPPPTPTPPPPNAHLTFHSPLPAPAMGHLGLAVDGASLEQMLEDHPTYLDSFSRLHHALMHGDGPLPEHFRAYIAIMAACRHQCNFLITEQKTAFLEAGGPEAWLQALTYAPKKLQDLHTVNIILAHRPWLMSEAHIEHLLKNSWSVGELTQAICILAQFHVLCSFIHGCGIESSYNDEVLQNSLALQLEQGCESNSPNSFELNEGGVAVLMARMRTISLSQHDYYHSEEDTRKSFEKLKKQTAEISSPAIDCGKPLESKCSNLSPDSDFTYVDFSKRGEKSQAPTLRSQECSWEEHGFSLINEFYSEVGDILDGKFKTAYDLTYYTMGPNHHVDTFLFRRAVWHYLQCLYGIRQDDYDYSQVNQLLERNLKTFIKTVTCFPERLRSTEQTNIMKGFLQSEKSLRNPACPSQHSVKVAHYLSCFRLKIHVLILVMESRLQSELLYALRALSRYLM